MIQPFIFPSDSRPATDEQRLIQVLPVPVPSPSGHPVSDAAGNHSRRSRQHVPQPSTPFQQVLRDSLDVVGPR